MVLLGAGLLGGLGAMLKGSAVPKSEQQGSIMHDVLLENAKIGSENIMYEEDVRNISKMFRAKYANILRQYGATDAIERMDQMPDRDHMSSAPTEEQSQERDLQRFQQQQAERRTPATREQLRGLARQNINDHELTRRKQLAMQIGSPLGGIVGQELGGLVSSLAGSRRAPGIRGFFGGTERRINENKARDIGRLVGNIGGGALSGHIASRMQNNPQIDAYMDQLGL